MKVIICGAGKVGFSIASYLEKYDHEVVIIDQNQELVNKVSERYDIRGICGFAADPETLEIAEAYEADMLIAVTNLDETNITSCEVAHALFEVPLKIARIRNQSYLKPKWSSLFSEENISIDVIISPEVEVAQAISRSLEFPGAFRIIPMLDSSINIIGVKCYSDTPLVNTPISHIGSLFPDSDFRVVAIYRENELIIPNLHEKLLEGDDIYFAADRNYVPNALIAFGHYDKGPRRVMILGGGNVGLALCKEIEENHEKISARIVESDKDRSRFISKQLNDTIVINGDALDSEILTEAGVVGTDTVIAVTNDDKVNALASLLAKRMGAENAMALINEPSSTPLVTSLGIDAVLNPREITVSRILGYIRRGLIRSVHSLQEGQCEIFEAKITDSSPLLGSSLDDVEIEGKVIVGAVARNREVFVPNDDTIFQLEDRLVVIAIDSAINETEAKLSAKVEY